MRISAKVGLLFLPTLLVGMLPAQGQITTWDFSPMLAANQELAASACLAGRCGTSVAPPPRRGPTTQPPQSFVTTAIARPTPRGAPSPFRYVADPAAHQRVLTDLIERIRTRSPQGAQEVRLVFAKYDYDGLYDGIAGPYGFGGDDAGSALTAYLVLGWLIANGQNDVPGGRATALAAHAQIAAALAETGTVSPAKRAELGEELKLQFVMAHAGWLNATKSGDAPRYAESIVQQFRRVYGIDLRQIALDARGLHRKG